MNLCFHGLLGKNSYKLRKKCPYSELFWSAVFPHFLAFRLNTLSVVSSMRENADQNNSKYGHFLRSHKLTHTNAISNGFFQKFISCIASFYSISIQSYSWAPFTQLCFAKYEWWVLLVLQFSYISAIFNSIFWWSSNFFHHMIKEEFYAVVAFFKNNLSLCKKLFSHADHHQLINEYIWDNAFAFYQIWIA